MLASKVSGKSHSQPVDYVSQLSYEEAEAKYEDALSHLAGLLQRTSRTSSPQAEAYLDNAASYANRMNELCGGPNGNEFMLSLRRELLLNCITGAVNSNRRDTVD